MEEIEKKQITPIEAAAAMMQFTMKSIENSWETLQPIMSAYLTDPVLSEGKEDELVREIYIAALALEMYCIPHAFDADEAHLIHTAMEEVMASPNLAGHRLREAIGEHYLPQFENIEAETLSDLAMALVEKSSLVLYERLALPLKPVDSTHSLLWAKLFPYLAQHVGKWPILMAKFTIQKD